MSTGTTNASTPTDQAVVPDIVFSATAQETIYLDAEDFPDPEYLRMNWVLVDGEPVFDPIVGWRWACPECGERGLMDEDDLLLDPHGSQHADGPFGRVVPLELTDLRRSELAG